MVDFYDIRLFRDKKHVEERVEFDINIISYKNAILYSENNDDFCKHTKKPKIKCGLILYKGVYYFFEQCLTDSLSLYIDNQYSYYVYIVRNIIAENMIKTKIHNKWLIRMESLFYYGGFYKSINIYGGSNYYYKSSIVDDKMYIPYGQSPSSLSDGEKMRDYFINFYKNYNDDKLILNNHVLRNNKLKKLGVRL